MSDIVAPDQLEHLFDATTLKRGRRYFQDSHVRHLSVEDEDSDVLRLHAVVNGSRQTPYRCEVLIEPAHASIRSACSCPMGAFCKHVAATLLEFDYQGHATPSQPGSAADDRAVHQWVQRLRNRRQQTGSTSSSRLFYVLDQRGGANQTLIQVYKASLRKNGTFGKMQLSNQWPRFALDETRPQYVMQEDIAAISWLRVLNEQSMSAPVIRGSIGYQFITAALATGRLVWQDASQPLSWGEPVEGAIGWQDYSGDAVIPEIQGLSDSASVIATDPPLALDRTTARISVLNVPMPAEALELLLRAPPMTPQQIQQHLPAIESFLEQCEAPMPPSVTPPETIRETPKPRLYLAEITPDNQAQSQPMPIIWVVFQYADFEVPWHLADDPVKTRDDAGNPVHIRRHHNLETTWLDQLPPLENLSSQQFEGALTLRQRRDWLDFLAWHLPKLSDAGWDVIIDESVDIQVLEPDAWYGEAADAPESGWFDLELGITQGEQTINLVPLLLEGLSHIREEAITDDNGQLALPEHLWLHDEHSLIRVPSDRVKPMLSLLLEFFRDRDATTDDGRLRLSRIDAARVLGESELQWQNSEQLQALGRELVTFDGLEKTPIPEGFEATPRDYQQQGIDWLQFLRRNHLGGILADDMGLGKTIQTLAHIWIEKAAGQLNAPALVVCPTSLLPNWRREAERFAPGLRVLTLHGPKRHHYLEQVGDSDLVLTSYPLITRDSDRLKATPWSVVIFDEAQNLKNPKTAMARAARAINTSQTIALTGTPMENHLGELWSLFDLIQPGYLGNQQAFRNGFRNPIEKDGDGDRRQALIRRIRPFLLRRTKDQVTPELPEKTEIVRTVELKGAQRDLYETIRASMDDKVRDLLAEKGVAQSQIEILEALLKLRQACCDPRLVDSSAHQNVYSAKLDYLLSMVDELLDEDRRILIFSQFTSMLSLIEDALAAKGYDYALLTGQTRDRATPVDRFQNGGVPIFLVSLKAGGVGLNLMAADCVIHYDPWWNPAVETQATDRAWRIGQDKPVFVYRLICEGTVEERMQSLQQRKAALADSVYGGSESFAGALSAEDIQALFQPIGA